MIENGFQLYHEVNFGKPPPHNGPKPERPPIPKPRPKDVFNDGKRKMPRPRPRGSKK